MHDLVIAVPFLLLAAIVGLPLAAALRGRAPRVRSVRAPRPPKSTLRSVSRSRMDEELQELIQRKRP